jgi:hypothetical protein
LSDLNLAEKELLVAVKLICMTRSAADNVAFEDYRRHPFTKSTTDWTEALGSLIDREILGHRDHSYFLTDRGHAEADLVHVAMLRDA